MYSVQAGSQSDPVALNYRHSLSRSHVRTHIHARAHARTYNTLFLSKFLSPFSAARAARCSRRPTYNNTSTLYRSTG